MSYELEDLITYEEPVDRKAYSAIVETLLKCSVEPGDKMEAMLNLAELEVIRRCCALMCDVISKRVSVEVD